MVDRLKTVASAVLHQKLVMWLLCLESVRCQDYDWSLETLLTLCDKNNGEGRGGEGMCFVVTCSSLGKYYRFFFRWVHSSL